MELEVSNEELVALTQEADVQGEVIVDEYAFALVVGVHLVVNEVSLGHRVVMIESVAALSGGIAVAAEVKKVERIHVIELGWLQLVK